LVIPKGELLEPGVVNVARPVLRGEGSRDAPDRPTAAPRTVKLPMLGAASA
jgi:hypothetical protein